MQEIWRDIKNYEGLYQISNYGKVKSLKRTIFRKNNYNLPLKEKVLREQNVNGYRFVRLCKNGKIKTHFIHRLVAETFIKNENNFEEINHKDENKSNNNINNLEWCTHKYNINYGSGNNRRSISEKRTKRGDNFVH